MRRLKNRKVWLLAVSAAVFALPFPTTTVPEWRLEVVDTANQPLSGVDVVERWSHGFVWGESSESRLSDENGVVTFQKRVFWCPLGIRLAATGIAYLNRIAMFHGARVGPWSTIWIRGGREFVFYEPGKELKDKAVYRP